MKQKKKKFKTEKYRTKLSKIYKIQQIVFDHREFHEIPMDFIDAGDAKNSAKTFDENSNIQIQIQLQRNRQRSYFSFLR